MFTLPAEEATITRFAARWAQARQAIAKADDVVASKRYAEFPVDLEPQVGLVPIGMNPQSKLWEFYHLRSGWDPRAEIDPSSVEIPTYDESGRLDVTGRGVVALAAAANAAHLFPPAGAMDSKAA